ncbi:MAG: NlpC/P60 family protein [Actinomycetota bacterium]
MPRRAAATLIAVGLLAAAPTPASAQSGQAGPYGGVPPGHWAAEQIGFVSDEAREWIPARKEGFGPGDHFTRRDLALAMFRAFPPPEGWSSTREFPDVEPGTPLASAAPYAVSRWWMKPKGGEFRPDGPVSRRDLDQALVRALGYYREAAAVSKLSTEDGVRLAPWWSTGFLIVAERLGLHTNLPDQFEAEELRPGQALTRAHAAHSLAQAAKITDQTRSSYAWRVDGFTDIVLPAMTPARIEAVKFALKYAGFPYVTAGEWFRPTGPDYPYGAQPQGGFDCTGLAWWVLQAPQHPSYDVVRWRGYDGWKLEPRTATEMAKATVTRYPFARTLPMDIAFFDMDNDPSRMEHAGLLLGNGWLLHASGARGGVTLERITGKWWQDRYQFSRRVIPNAA